MMSTVFHAGERDVQARAGVAEMARRVGRTIQSRIPPSVDDFLRTQRLAIVGASAPDGQVWATPLTGSPGFLQVLDARTLQIAGPAQPGDPFVGHLAVGQPLGMLVIDLAERSRLRLNGPVAAAAADRFVLRVDEVYGNCQKYIQKRVFDTAASQDNVLAEIQRTSGLTAAQQIWIGRSDTFFIASMHAEAGADVSHRGGRSGFVQVLGASSLLWPDYPGNATFNTPGKLAVDPRAGLLFVDFESGRILQLTGTARVIWNPDRGADDVGAERLVEFSIVEVVERSGVSALRRRFVEYSRFNPVVRPLTE